MLVAIIGLNHLQDVRLSFGCTVAESIGSANRFRKNSETQRDKYPYDANNAQKLDQCKCSVSSNAHGTSCRPTLVK
jgi:hypothetical protein